MYTNMPELPTYYLASYDLHCFLLIGIEKVSRTDLRTFGELNIFRLVTVIIIKFTY